VRRSEDVRPPHSPSRVGAFLVAAVVHGLTVAFGLGGVALLALAWRSPSVLVRGLVAATGVAALCVAWVLRPRPATRPEGVVTAARFPALYALSGRVTEALGVEAVTGIAIGPDFSMSMRRVGWSGRTFVTIGLPLFTVLDGQERAAVLAHELAHRANGDPVRGAFVGSALQTLRRWYQLFHPRRVWPQRIVAFVPIFLTNVFSLSLAWGARGLGVLTIRLAWRDSQQAEYYADVLAARVAGTRATVSALQKLALEDAYRQAQHSASLDSRDAGPSVFDDLRGRAALYHPSGDEEAAAVDLDEAVRPDATHPPPGFRVAALRAHPATGARVALSAAESEMIELEMRSVEPEVQRELVDRHRAQLYQGGSLT
jgi:heat shock protein HtpX